MKKAKLPMTVAQAIQLYGVIDALLQQFERDNRAARRRARLSNRKSEIANPKP